MCLASATLEPRGLASAEEEDGAPVVVVLFFRQLPRQTYRQWLRDLPNDEFARWLLADPSAIPQLHLALQSGE